MLQDQQQRPSFTFDRERRDGVNGWIGGSTSGKELGCHDSQRRGGDDPVHDLGPAAGRLEVREAVPITRKAIQFKTRSTRSRILERIIPLLSTNSYARDLTSEKPPLC